MNIEAFISSGIIETYCMGAATDEERELVEKMAAESKEVRDEILAVNEALKIYASVSGKTPAAKLKDKIMNAIFGTEQTPGKVPFPVNLKTNPFVGFWMKYLADNNIAPPEGYEYAYWHDLPGNDKQATYAVWAYKGASLEETHDSEDEYLLMLKGECSVTIGGKPGYYKEGDLIYIPKNTIHKTIVLSDEPMMLIGQRVAA